MMTQRFRGTIRKHYEMLPSAAAAMAIATAFLPLRANAQQNTGKQINSFLSNGGTWIYLGAGLARPLLAGGGTAPRESVRTADALLTSLAFTEALKHTIREERPDSSDRDSFPSGHTTAAFAVATMEANYHPKEAPYWYLGAALIAESRVDLHRHYIHDVVAGAAIGYLTARWELTSHRGLILSPVIRTESGRSGMSLAYTF